MNDITDYDGAICPYCRRVTTAQSAGLYTCIGCGKVFRVGEPGWFLVALRLRVSALYALLDLAEREGLDGEVAWLRDQIDGLDK